MPHLEKVPCVLIWTKEEFRLTFFHFCALKLVPVYVCQNKLIGATKTVKSLSLQIYIKVRHPYFRLYL